MSSVSCRVPVQCPRSHRILNQDPHGNRYTMRVPCNNCPSCKNRIALDDILKFKEGINHRGDVWWQRGFEMDHPDYRKTLRRYLDKLNKHGIATASITVDFGMRRVRYFFHPPIPGEVATSHVTVRSLKRTIAAYANLRRLKSVREARTCRASKTRPCWPKSEAERKRDYRDKRPPEQKHKLICASPLGPRRFDALSKARIGRIVSDFERLSPFEVDALFVLNRPWPRTVTTPVVTPASPSWPSSPANSPEARSNDVNRMERRLERASWYDSSG